MTYDRGGLDRVHAHLSRNDTGRAQHVLSPERTRAAADLAARATSAGAYPVFVAPPELPDVEGER